jgi:hypothetical protein
MNSIAIFTMIGSMVAVFVAFAALLAALYRRGQNEGRMTEILSHLTAMGHDHEARLRALEKGN